MRGSLHHYDAKPSTIPAAAYSALTACSKLQCLDVNVGRHVWDHMLPDGRRLPHLHAVFSSHPLDAGLDRLVKCCPRLQTIGGHPDCEAIRVRWLLDACKEYEGDKLSELPLFIRQSMAAAGSEAAAATLL